MMILSNIRRFGRDENAISSVEYAVLLAIIGTGIAAAVIGLETQVGINITDATNTLAGS